MGLDKLYAIWWDFWQIPYYKVYETKGNKVVKIFNQRVVNSVKGSNIALIDKPNKLCWWITNDYFTNKAQILFIVDINNAVPLRVEIKKEVTGELIIKEKTVKKLSIDKVKQNVDKKDGLPKIKAEIHFPSTLLHQLIEAHFVHETLSEPPSKWEALMPVLIVGLIVAGFLLWQLMSSGIGGIS